MKRDFYVGVVLHLSDDGNGHAMIMEFNVFFYYNENDYGNGYYMDIVPVSGMSDGMYLDIRYDRDFNDSVDTDILKYVANFCFNRWTGKNGAWTIESIKLTMKEDI